ncbi:MAG: DUF523 domain-containing protein [Planctomycetota bacterium]|nr:DUF523 domain-containing protein [Planctomycetota bacterium]
MDAVLVSACLAGRACRYDGTDEHQPALLEQLEREGVAVVPFCPEEAGGLGTPRPAAKLHGGDGREVLDGRATVRTESGSDVTEQFLDGARQAVAAAKSGGCTVAYLKARSPSCGCVHVHMEAGLAEGYGVTAAALRRAGVTTISVD